MLQKEVAVFIKFIYKTGLNSIVRFFMQYPINEIFQTIQGEGHFTGIPAIFIRLQGCDVGCSWCDTRHTWDLSAQQQVDPQQVIQVDRLAQGHWSYLSVDAILKAIENKGWSSRHVVLTGGEPCLYDLEPLCRALERQGMQVQIETSGTSEVRVTPSAWVTVSPKIGMKGKKEVLQSALRRADEIKHPVAIDRHIDELDALLAPIESLYVLLCSLLVKKKCNCFSNSYMPRKKLAIIYSNTQVFSH